MKSHMRNKAVFTGVIFLFLSAVIFFIILYSNLIGIWKDLRRFSKMDYEGAFFSMYDISCYREEDFAAYRGVLTVKAEQPVERWSVLSRYLDRIFSSKNTVTNVFLGLDPVVLWEKSQHKEEKWVKNLDQYLISYITARQGVSFDILLPTYPLSNWTELSASQLEENLDSYSRLIEDLGGYSNVHIYFLGGEQWLIANPANYLERGQTNEDVSRKIFFYTFCDQEYQITPANSSVLFERLTSQVEQERESPTVYPDLSDWCIFFFGDSVFDYFSGSLSIPGVVNGLTGARTYNLGYSGASATEDPMAVLSFNYMVNHFLELNTGGVDKNSNYYRGLVDYIEEDHEDKKCCFVIEFGLNDYFGGRTVENPLDGYDVGTYAGALRTGVKTLQDAYPEAEILLLAPTYAEVFSGGTEINGVNGGVLTDYVDAALRVAEEMGVHCLNNYADSGINADSQARYLTDGVHPNEAGSFLLGNCILEYIGSISSEN